MATPKQLHSIIQDKIDASRHDLYTGLPAKIVFYDANTQSCTAQPLLQTGELPMPPVYQVPVIFPAGGGAVLSFPVKAGDRCWLAYSMYPIADLVSGNGDTASDNPMARPHDMNECVAYVGMGTRQKNYQPDPSLVMLRFGQTKFTLDDAGNATLEGNLHITKKLTVEDTIEATNEITGKDFVSSELGVSFNNHQHHYYWTDDAGDADTERPQ